jgi:RNA polymerase sigma-70 factor (ECF subfamily)
MSSLARPRWAWPAFEADDSATDGEAWAAVYDAHAEQVRCFARRLLGDADAAEDLLHDVFVCLPEALRRFRGDAELSTFLLSIAARRAKNYIRAAVRQRAALARLAQETAAHGVSPERAAGDEELMLALSSALDTLPLAQRIAFVLCDIEERSSAEAAEIAGIPAATLRTRLHHARRRLRETLSARWP